MGNARVIDRRAAILPKPWLTLFEKLRFVLGVRYCKHYKSASSSGLISAIIIKTLMENREEIEEAYAEAQRDLASVGIESALGTRLRETFGLPDPGRTARNNPLGGTSTDTLKDAKCRRGKLAGVAQRRSKAQSKGPKSRAAPVSKVGKSIRVDAGDTGAGGLQDSAQDLAELGASVMLDGLDQEKRR